MSNDILGQEVGTTQDGRKIYEATKNTKVNIVDWTHICKIIKNDLETEKLIEIRAGNGIISVNDKHILIDKECCARLSKSDNYMKNGKIYSGKYFNGIGIFLLSSSTGIPLFPTYYVNIEINDILQNCLTGKTMPLYEYMGSRYQYNDRIESNMFAVLKAVKEMQENQN